MIRFRPSAMTRWAMSLSPGPSSVALALDGQGGCGVRRADHADIGGDDVGLF